ncbi:F-box/kelch-repeat protein At3g23880-like [Silene latifolia]|uniref:F-box/kelch-repeat protein At3g23880-like n=1 Tax=Silene latifolia TaxID=37657 RepID=UPI003D7811FE
MASTNTKKHSKTSDAYQYLPSELWTNHILPTLPVKTLLRFRSVCKLWRSIIDDPPFVADHFILSTNNVHKNQAIAIENLGDRGKEGRRLTVTDRNTLTKQADVFHHPDEYYFQACCNGLFLVEESPYRYIISGRSRYMELWNPSIRQSLRLPPCPLAHGTNDKMAYIFGFRPLRNDYVVYAFRLDEHTPMKASVAVYTLSDNLWNIRNYKLSVPRSLFMPFRKRMCGNECIFLDGALHWFGRPPNYRYEPRRTYLVSFDFEVENFSYIELPDSSPWPAITRTYRFLFVLDKSLAIFIISAAYSSIWVLKNEMWNLLFSTTSCLKGFNYICKHRHVVTKLFYAEDGGITMAYGQVGYKIMSDKIKKLDKSLSSYLILDTYMESLVLHKGCQGQILHSLPINRTDENSTTI